MKDEGSYNCDSCGEEIVVPVDLSAGSSQEVAVIGCFPSFIIGFHRRP
jgi:hypothetical protein